MQFEGKASSIGPTSSTGWTCVWWDVEADARVIESTPVPFLSIDDDPYLEICARGDDEAVVVARMDRPLDEASAVAMADTLLRMFGPPEAAHPLAKVLRTPDIDLDDLVTELRLLLYLPQLEEPLQSLGVVMARSDDLGLRMAAALAGPTSLMNAGNSWTALTPHALDEVNAGPLAAAVSAVAGRKERQLLLWRNGRAFGVGVWRRGRVEGDWAWNEAWIDVTPDPLDHERSAVEALTAVAIGEVDRAKVRALLARTKADIETLSELLGILGLPVTPLAQLEPDTRAPGPGSQGVEWAELIGKTTAKRATFTAARADWKRPVAARYRVPYWFFTIFTIVMASAAVLMTTLQVMVLATDAGVLGVGYALSDRDGALVDQAGARSDEWLWLAVFVALSAVLIPTSVGRIKRLRPPRGVTPD